MDPVTVRVEPAGPLKGEIRVPGDKSVSHRALLLNALSGGRARIAGLADGEDVRATRSACLAMGARVVEEDGAVLVTGCAETAREPDDVIDCGNSGTSLRLLLGALAGREGHAVLTGDASLRRRPMGRVVAPLRAMGARIDGRDGGKLAPLAVRGQPLSAASHDLPVASAQVKSALLLAGLGCGVRVREPRRSRDHTERMLCAMGAALAERDGWIALEPGALSPVDVAVPGDLSAAAFPLVAAAVVPGSEIVVRGVGNNPTRTGALDVLAAMGADLEVIPAEAASGEPVADLVMRHAPLRGVHVGGELALRSIDELVVLAIAAAFAEGTTTITDAAELRVKESDRIARVASGLRALGCRVEEAPDGMIIEGGRPRGPARIDAEGDHRLAMAFAVCGLAAEGGIEIAGAGSVRSSWPGFFEALYGLLRR